MRAVVENGHRNIRLVVAFGKLFEAVLQRPVEIGADLDIPSDGKIVAFRDRGQFVEYEMRLAYVVGRNDGRGRQRLFERGEFFFLRDMPVFLHKI